MLLFLKTWEFIELMKLVLETSSQFHISSRTIYFLWRHRNKIGRTWGLTRITCPWFGDPFPRSTTVDSNNSYSGRRAPCPAASRTVQLPSTRPLGSPLFSMNGWRLRTILSVGFSATPWNLLNPVTWTVTGEGPSEPIYLVMRLEQRWNLALPAGEPG